MFSVEIFLIPNSISAASFAPYIGDRRIALIALLFVILYFSCIQFSWPRGVFTSPYWVQACIAPTIRFLLIPGVMPPPRNMNGTSYAFVCSAFSICLVMCDSCNKLCQIIFPRYLYSYTRSMISPWQVSYPSQEAMYFVFVMFSSNEYLTKTVSNVSIIVWAWAQPFAIITMSSAKASIPTYQLFTVIPSLLFSNSRIICLMIRLNRIGEVLAPCLTPFQFVIGSYSSLLIMNVDLSLQQIYSSSWMTSFGTSSPIKC